MILKQGCQWQNQFTGIGSRGTELSYLAASVAIGVMVNGKRKRWHQTVQSHVSSEG